MTIQYDPERNFLWVLTRVRGTVLKAVLLKPFFWLLLGVHGGLLAIDRLVPYDDSGCVSTHNTTCAPLYGEFLPVLDWSAIGSLTGFLVRLSPSSLAPAPLA
jgi:hypothetical protein